MPAKRLKADPVDAESELNEACLEAVDPYPGRTSIPFRVQCLRRRCPAEGEPFETYLSIVRARRDKDESACSHCRRQERARRRRSEMITLGRMLPMVEITSTRSAVRSWCMRCWNVCDPGPRLGNIKNGQQGGCEHCGGRRRYDEEVARHMARAWGYEPDPEIPYTNDATKWPGLCLAENHPCDPVLNSRFRSGPCATCADHGFKPDRPALVYLLVGPAIQAAKIGICEDHPRNTRLDEHRRNGWIVVQTERFEIGADARAVEELVVRSWRSAGYASVLKNGTTYDGYRETVSIVRLTLDEISSAVREIIATVRGHTSTEDLSWDPLCDGFADGAPHRVALVPTIVAIAR